MRRFKGAFMKYERIAIITLFLILSVFIIRDYMYSLTVYGSSDEASPEIMKSINPMDDINFVYSDMGEGINIGNSLDACDWSYFGSAYSVAFQAAIVYNSAPWTGWDASEYRYFDNNGRIAISWNISSLNSNLSSKAGDFSIQLVNHKKEYQGTNVTCDVKAFTVTLKDGSVIQGSESVIGRHTLTFNNDVTPYIALNLGQYGLMSSDLIGATVSIDLEISEFYRNINEQIAYLEKFWGNPRISENLIATIKDGGFKTVRIPITYFNHISPDGTIDKEFLDRVEQVVDWVLKYDMYCIIDVHHDTGNQGWIMSSESSYTKNREKVGYIFRQIAERFKNKNKHLILEGLNEAVNDQTQWFNIPSNDVAVMNKWNQLFVDSVRSTGGNNSDRYLLVNTYAALPLDECLSVFTMPSDTAQNRIFVGIHCYFTQNNIASSFNTIDKYSSKYHFIIGEWAFDAQKYDRNAYTQEFMNHAKSRNIPAVYWDTGNVDRMGILYRKTLTWHSKQILDMVAGK